MIGITRAIFRIFEPITLPIAMSECPLLTATIEAATSGKDVPRAIIVKPMKNSYIIVKLLLRRKKWQPMNV